MGNVNLRLQFVLFVYIIYESYQSLEVIPERVKLTYSNDKYVVNNSVNIRRYTRRGPYVFNFWGDIKHTWDNNVTVDIILYEYLHNEYKRSFVEFHFKLCDLINKDQLIGVAIRNRGIKCPLKVGYNGITNATIFFPKFPYVFPFERCKAEVIFRTEPSHDLIGVGHVFVSIKQS